MARRQTAAVGQPQTRVARLIHSPRVAPEQPSRSKQTRSRLQPKASVPIDPSADSPSATGPSRILPACFSRPRKSNPSGRSRIIGFAFEIQPGPQARPGALDRAPISLEGPSLLT